jgi:hypothetical protein
MTQAHSPLRAGGQGDLLALDVSIFRRPPTIGVARRTSAGGALLDNLDETALTRDNLFDIGFDEALLRLAHLARADTEPDGFFVQTGETDACFWRLCGQLHELDGRLWRLDLRGDCPVAALDDVLRVLDWPQVPLVFQLVRLGLTLQEADFRRLIRESG